MALAAVERPVTRRPAAAAAPPEDEVEAAGAATVKSSGESLRAMPEDGGADDADEDDTEKKPDERGTDDIELISDKGNDAFDDAKEKLEEDDELGMKEDDEDEDAVEAREKRVCPYAGTEPEAAQA
jgi:NACalpha-BTF3-like transcription factor